MATKAKEIALNIPEDPDKDLKTTAAKSDALVENTEPKKDPADEIAELKKQMADVTELLKTSLAAMMQNAQASAAEAMAEKPAADKETVTDFTGVSMAGDEGTEWEEYETVRTIRARKGMEKTVLVSVNDRNVLIPLDGRAYKLRKPHAQVLLDSMEADIAADEFAESVPHDAAPKGYDQLVADMENLKKLLKENGIMV